MREGGNSSVNTASEAQIYSKIPDSKTYDSDTSIDLLESKFTTKLNMNKARTLNDSHDSQTWKNQFGNSNLSDLNIDDLFSSGSFSINEIEQDQDLN